MNTFGSSGLSDDEIGMLRGLVVRRRNAEAERWLVRRGFSAERASRIILDQEMEMSNAIYAAPFWDIVFAVVPLLVTIAFLAMAADTRPEPLMEKGDWMYTGTKRTLILAGIVSPLVLISAFFGARASLQIFRSLKAHLRYPLKSSYE
jgi:hypothetical protein